MVPASDSRAERLIPSGARPLIALVVGAGLVSMAIWYVAAGGLQGGLVDHDAPPRTPLAFTVDLNSAGPVELAQLPGVGPALARRIVDHRTAVGPFTRVDDLLDVPGIGPLSLERMRPHLRPPVPTPPAAETKP